MKIACNSPALFHAQSDNPPEHASLAAMFAWRRWLQQSTVQEEPYRRRAVDKLILCLNMNEAHLSLASLQLSSLPPALPPLLRSLDISGNRLNSLPETLPAMLQFLDAGHNQLLTLPSRLPRELKDLNLCHNQLESLPDGLPSGLKKIIVSRNRLRRLPEKLPWSLRELHAGFNCLSRLPDGLPDMLVVLTAEMNKLKRLPVTLPSCLKVLRADRNSLDRLPPRWPTGMDIISLRDNRLTDIPVQWRHLGPHSQIDVGNNPLARPALARIRRQHQCLQYQGPHIAVSAAERRPDQAAGHMRRQSSLRQVASWWRSLADICVGPSR
ncbi:hypothetical protein [Martelella alba]|uniref:Leucine rich repeat (LRR) protein n=1 Tax=Martelella alba TaxID=2590451 RepID=A0ABY2SML6_9HYPH|nr:hypothetical protein [Martelella alba]TKI04873.1 hypothetical protein FCN80_16260 [Martelella alba]